MTGRQRVSRRAAIGIAGASLLSFGTAAFAQAWPAKPIRLVVSFPPGSSPDVVARAIVPGLSQALGTPIVIDNRSGVGGVLGSDIVAKSPADGYTILITSGSSMAISVHTMAKMPFDPVADLVPVAAAARIELFLVTRPDLNVGSFADFIKLVRSNPGKLTYGSPGVGSAPHVATEMLKSYENLFAVHIPYRGSAPALQDLLGGTLDFAFDPGIALTHVRAGRLKLLAVGGTRRSSLFPDVPTLQELGLKGFDVGTTHAVYAPAGTPRAIVDRLNAEINRLLVRPEVAQQIRGLGAEPTPMSPAELRRIIDDDSRRFGAIVRERNIKES